MKLKGILFIIIFLIPLYVNAQNNSGVLTVNSNPGGANAVLEGDVKVTGITPVSFKQLLIGNYKLKLSKPGYENFKTTITVDPTRHFEITADLKPKSKLKAAFRSMIFPGWGQRYLGKNNRGAVFTLLSVGAVASYFWVDNDFDDKYRYFVDKKNEFDKVASIGNLTELRRVYQELNIAQTDAYDAENIRRYTIGAVAALWSLNVLDAFFASINKETISVKSLSVEPSAYGDGLKLTLAKSF